MVRVVFRKGYLGRILATQTDQPVTSFEYQQVLCDSGQQAANEHHWKMTFIQGDAFDSKAKAVFKPTQHAVALHACGDLHVRLMQYGSEWDCCDDHLTLLLSLDSVGTIPADVETGEGFFSLIV